MDWFPLHLAAWGLDRETDLAVPIPTPLHVSQHLFSIPRAVSAFPVLPLAGWKALVADSAVLWLRRPRCALRRTRLMATQAAQRAAWCKPLVQHKMLSPHLHTGLWQCMPDWCRWHWQGRQLCTRGPQGTTQAASSLSANKQGQATVSNAGALWVS